MRSTGLLKWFVAYFVKQHAVRSAILFFFFVSGACGLIYQVVWLRVLGLIFGNTTFSTSTVVAGFMAGLGLGALFFGRWIDRRSDPIRVYGFLEGGVAVYSFLTPLLWKLIEFIYVHYYRAFDPSFIHFSLIKFVLCFLALLLPTFLMGGTLPVLCKYFVTRDDDVARPVGLLYAWNTLGAVLGVVVSGFFALYLLGVWQTVYLAGILNLVICLACVKILSPAEEKKTYDKGPLPQQLLPSGPQPDVAAPLFSKQRVLHGALLILFGISGAVSMVYEIAWTRVLAIVLGSSIYAFSVMLATFLTGISLGSFLLSKYAGKFPVNLVTFSIFQFLTAAFVFLGLNRFDEMPFYFVRVFEWSGGSVFLIELGKFLLCALVMFFPTLLIGAMFACFIHVYHHTRSLGREVGTAYFSNTVGNILGSALTGFLIIPLIGIQNTLMTGAAVNAAVGAAAFLFAVKKAGWRSFAAMAGALVLVFVSAKTVRSWDKAVITSGAMVKPFQALGLSKEQFLRTVRERETLFYKEGTSATVNVSRVKDNISMAVNGKADASNGPDSLNQYFLGHLPMLIQPEAKKALVIGLGSGSTVAAVASHPVEKIDVVEIEEAVLPASRFFSDLNRGALEDDRVRVFINDGRNFLLVSEELYDVIISEPSNPWMAGVANLFSLEHYQNMKRRLAPDGVVSQWVHAYSMSPEDLRMIVRTFTAVFPHTNLWFSYYPDLLMIGRKTETPLDFGMLKETFNRPEILQDFKPYGIPTAEGMLSSFWLGDEELRRLAEGGRINSDNYPFLEFSAPRNLYKDTLQENFDFIHSFRGRVLPEMKNLEPPADRNIRLHNELGLGFISKRMFREAQEELEKALAMDPENAEALQNTGILLYEQHALEKAVVRLLKAGERNPKLPKTHYYLGKIFAEKEQGERAVYEFGQAALLDPDNPSYFRALGDALSKMERFQDALKAYDLVLALKGSDYDVLNRMTNIAFEIGNLSAQQSLSRKFLDSYPKTIEAYEKVGKAFEDGNHFDEALSVYLALAAQFPEDASVYLHLTRIYGKMGRMEEAKKALNRAIRLRPDLRKNSNIAKLLKAL